MVPDCTSIRKMEPSLNILFLDKNIIDPDELYMTDISRLPLTAALSFIGFKVFFKFCIFSVFITKNAPLK